MKQTFSITASLRDAIKVAAIIDDVNLAAVYNLRILQVSTNAWVLQCQHPDNQYMDEFEVDVFLYDIEQVFGALEVELSEINETIL